jgi:DNA-binding Lrp family transcriptional regulator
MPRDITDRKLLNLVQAGFPLTPEPFAALGEKLGVSEQDVIDRIMRLKSEGLIRQLSPVIDGRRLGFQTTLVAMRVTEDDRARAEDVLCRHPGVSHGYERSHHFNIWFTLALPGGADVDEELARISEGLDVEAIFSLPATRLFKIGAYFDVGGDGQGHRMPTNDSGALPETIDISDADRALLVEMQQDLPLVSRPFRDMAERLGLDEEAFIERCLKLQSLGVMRRFGASVNHRKAGFSGNGMACWIVPEERVDEVGPGLAALPEVSHCYERATNPEWRHNIFAMIHGRVHEDCERIAGQASEDLGLDAPMVLFSTREFKKERVRYLA